MEEMIKILSIDIESKYLSMVKPLGDENSKTLGFFPSGAFDESARKKMILVAVDKDDNFMGYLLYRIAKHRVIIVHLCIKVEYRGLNITKKLVDKLRELTKDNYLGIGLSCREDYEASKVWPKLNFVVRYEKRGRKKSGSILKFWWLDFGKPDLFTDIHSDLLKVVVDANIFYSFEEESKESVEAKAVLADWLEEYIQIFISDELFNEIDRNTNVSEKTKWRIIAHQFDIVRSDKERIDDIIAILKTILPNTKSESDESDIRQLAHSIAGNTDIFLTRDSKILNSSTEILREFNIKVMPPAELVRDIDKVANAIDYEPVRAGGTLIELIQVDATSESELTLKFLNYTQREGKSDFECNLRIYFAHPKRFKIVTIRDTELGYIGLVVIEKVEDGKIHVPLLRVIKSRISELLAKYLIEYVIHYTVLEKKTVTKLTDKYFPKEIESLLVTKGFILLENFWIKYSLKKIISFDELFKELLNEHSISAFEKKIIKEGFQNLETTNKINDQLQIEEMIFPGKLSTLSLPVFIIPIRPLWAMNLFDEHLASSDLFGAKPKLALNTENVYYRSCIPAILRAPGRVLWYVSDDNEFPGSKSLRACSYIDEVVIDKPKILFSKYHNLGVYEWKNIFEIAQRDINKSIMAFRFHRTEQFNEPINLELLRNTILKTEKKNINLQSPFEITTLSFYELYKLGMNI